MTEFEKVLQESLRDLEQGASNIEECLRRYPSHAPELEPILLTSAYLERVRQVNISDPFRARVRTKLIQQMQARPRKRARSSFLFVRLATGFAAVVLALLATGTVYAQSALPGEIFYPWKRTSENTWRAISPDPLGTDLAIAERRVDELIAVSEDPILYAQTLNAYLEVADRLKSEVNAEIEARILAILDSQIEELRQSGIVLPQPDGEVPPPIQEPTSTPPTTPTAIPLPVVETPEVKPTRLPQLVPSVQVPSEPTIDVPPLDVPPVQDPPQILPTVELPSVIP